MAEPKKKLTSARSGNRRSQLRLKPVGLTYCPKCKTAIKPHTVCYVCGTYNGETVIDMDKKSRKTKEAETISADESK